MHQPRKRFGQHFLHDQRIIERMIASINPQTDENLLEIGPGVPGALTFPLLRRCHELTAVELDRDLVPILQQRAQDIGELTLINEDILKFEIANLARDKRFRIVGNLPYNISTPLMFHLLKSVEYIQDMHFMVQKEVALRLVANTGDNNYGRLSIMMQYYCKADYLFDVPPACFTPAPKVDSAIVRLTPLALPGYDVDDFALFSELVKTAFAQRRKTISNSLKSMIETDGFMHCDVDKKLRAENLSGHDFACLARTITPGESNA